jgi:cytochrome c peroxidase
MHFRSFGIAAACAIATAATVFLTAGQSSLAGANRPATETLPEAARLMAEYQRPSWIPYPEDNPHSEAKEQLGRALFFDPRLSRSNMQSCSSCHNPSFAWGDGLPKGVGDHMNQLGRRSPSILNSAWAEAFMWDGRFETLEQQALGPIQSGVEMNMSIADLLPKLQAVEEYRRMFGAAFDANPEITAEKIAMAIATYERTVVSGAAPFDRWIAGDAGAISESAQRGFVLFNGKANCAACHSGWRFTDDSFHDIGLAGDDIGRGKQLPNVAKMQHAFKTPGLRNIDRRFPYMHDGSVVTLEAAIELYNTGGILRPSLSDEMKPLGLMEQDKADLLAFLKTLTSQDPPVQYVMLPR